MNGIFITVNTDAGYSNTHKVGSYAYWIRGTNLFLKGSGMFRGHCEGSWQAEMKAMINALHVLRKTAHPPVIGFIFNRDCHAARSGRYGELRQRLKKEIKHFRLDAIKRLGKHHFKNITKKQKQYAIFRHVKGHSDVDDKRSYVNRWLDARCREHLGEWLKNHKEKNIT